MPKPSRKASPPRKKKLPHKRRMFVEALVGPANGNRTKAAAMAGYTHPKQEGHRLLTFADVSGAVAERLDRMADAMSSEEIIARLSGIARADMTPFYEMVEVEVEWSALEKEAIEAAAAAAKKAGVEYKEPAKRKRKRAYLDVSTAIENGMGWLIKAHKEGEYGADIKLHDAQAALVDLAKIRGLVKTNPPPPPPAYLPIVEVLKVLPLEVKRLVVAELQKQRAIEIEAREA